MPIILLQLIPRKFPAAVKRVLLGGLAIVLLAPLARAQTVFTQGNALSNRTFNTDTGPTNSQLNLDFPISQAGVLQSLVTWGQNTGPGGPTGIGESFQLYVLRPLNSTNYQVVFSTSSLTVTNVGTNLFVVSGVPFLLQTNDVIAHYGRGIAFSNNTGGPSSSYVAVNLPAPVVGTTITVPSATYPLYNDGGRDYAIQVQVEQPILVTTNGDSGPGSLRQAVLTAGAFDGASIINFATNLSGATITLTNEIALDSSVAVDASGLPGGLTIHGGGSNRIFSVPSGKTVLLTGLALTGGIENLGGALYNLGTVTLNQCTLSGNSAETGGAIYNDFSGVLTLDQCTIAGNQTFNGGSGIASGGRLTVDRCTFTDNLAPLLQYSVGGAIYAVGEVILTRSTFVGNQVGFTGGAINQEQGNLTISNCTIFGNRAGDPFFGGGGGIFFRGDTLILSSSIVASNSTYDLFDILGHGTVTNCLIGIDPHLSPLGDNGGPTRTMVPLAGSPAIDAAGTSSSFTTDQRGFPRLSGSALDIGAVEVLPALVTNTNANGAGSLRAAVLAGSDNISFAPALSGQTIILTNNLALTKYVDINASNLPGGVTVSGGNVLPVLFDIRSGTTVFLTNLKVTGENFSNLLQNGYPPKAAIVNRGTLTLNNCEVSDNFGGAIYSFGGDMTLNNCTLSGNQAFWGGAIYSERGSGLRLNNCRLSDNQAIGIGGGYGGAIYTFGAGSLSLNNCTLSGNWSDDGGAIYAEGDATTLSNCTLSGNEGDHWGAAIFAYNGDLTLTHCTLSDNTTFVTGGTTIYVHGGTLATITASLIAGNSFAHLQDAAEILLEDVPEFNATNCIIGNGFGSGLTNGLNGNQVGTSAAPIQPLLAPLGNYGGPTQTRPPLPGSPAIDAAGAPSLPTDQRGLPRLSGVAADIGAVELQQSVVSNTQNSGSGSLRVAVTATSELVRFAPNLSGQTITLASQITLSNPVAIDASSLPGGMQINGNASSRIFEVLSGSTVVLDSLTLTNGRAIGGSGGGILNAGNLTVNRCTLVGNKADFYGGGIENNGSESLVINQSTFTANQCNQGGGGALDIGMGPVLLQQSTIVGNVAASIGGAGGIGNYSSGVTINNSVVAGNTSPGQPNLEGNPMTFTGVNLTNGTPLLAPLGNYGGPTPTMPPRPGSPALNAATNGTSFATDQRGLPRIVGTFADLGAVEGVFNPNYPIVNFTKLGTGNVRFNFTNLSGPSYRVLASTNAAAPLNTWTDLGAPIEAPASSFTFTDLQATNYPSRFYRVTTP